jgi:hypothetical protein
VMSVRSFDMEENRFSVIGEFWTCPPSQMKVRCRLFA